MKPEPRRRTSARRKRSAVERIERGESTVEDEARKLRVSTFAVKQWRAKARREREGRLDHATERYAGDGGAEVGTESGAGHGGGGEDSPRLSRALSSAGIDEGSDNGASPDAGGGPAESIPAPDADAMVALVAMGREQLLRFLATALGCDVSDPRVQKACTLSDESREALKPFAPYVAAKFPELAADSADAPFWIFCGLAGASLANGTIELWKLRPKKEKPGPPQEPGRVRTIDIQAQAVS